MKKNLSRLFATFITSLLLLTSCTSTTMSDFTVTFNGNGGTLISGTEVQKVQNASEIVPPTYERMGYNFDGWNKNINTISVDTTVNAKWLEKSKDTSLSIEGFSQDGSLFSFKVNNDVNIFSYTDKVTISSKSSWKLFSDIEGKIEVVTKTISLSIGDNTNYILVTSENGEYAFYTVVTRRLNMFTVAFDTDGGTVIPSQQVQEESLIQEVPNPEKPHYSFSRWDYDFSEPVMRNMTVTASYTINKYEITFKNYDGTTLQKTEWDYNSMPAYYGSTPTKKSTDRYTYTFSGWSPTVVEVTGNATYTAQFTNTIRTYTIIWKNYDGTIIETDTNVAYGATPTYNHATPTRAADSQYSYTFSGWSPAVTAVAGNRTYIAKFSILIIELANYFGTYPQTKVTNSTLVNQLNSTAGTLPTSSDGKSWISYKYYIEGSNSTDFMWYQDISLSGDKYRGVYFTSYRPSSTMASSSTYYSYQDDNGYYINTVYWFKYEPILWDVLSINEEAGPLVVSSKILDGQEYYHSTSNRIIGGSTIYPNNYKESNIRAWLNTDFYNTAFSATEQTSILTTNVDNGPTSTHSPINPYACENTNDKLFLLSYKDASNGNYGFRISALDDSSRIRQATDYAKTMGVYVSTYYYDRSMWLLRSPGGGENKNSYVEESSKISINGSIDLAFRGVLPAFRINL